MRIGSPIPHKKARIEIIPLIDIMFFLLASFMMVSLSQVHMKGMKVNLPAGSSGETQNKREYVSLSVDKDGYFYFDKTRMDIDQLVQTMQQVHQATPDAKVFVRGDRDAIHGNVIRLLNVIRSAGFYKMAFEIKSQAGQGIPGPGR
jgi:biopolymer transport protein ExbD